MIRYVYADLWSIVRVHNIIARMVAYMCYLLFACVSNLTIFITTEPPSHFAGSCYLAAGYITDP